ncbi:hypothetical protein [uncultured Roseibium sp.]|uniref:hypothetical protein n=1 Tax=uncultured Roseibium sp. TaxID=1936171 RepID=UPI00262CA5CB|nr:hypothetical protein [uncultured Roseibium sp.]
MFPKPVFAPVGRVSGPVTATANRLNDVFLLDLDALVRNDQAHLEYGLANYLDDFAKLRPCYLLSRSSYNDVLLRLPERLIRSLTGVFANSGAELWSQNEVMIRHEHDFSDDLFEFVAKVVQQSNYPAKKTPTIECGPASLRICLAGTNSTARQIENYRIWESERGELTVILDEFSARFPNYEVYRDTDHSLLIMPGSFNSSIVRNHLIKRHKSARLIAYLKHRSVSSFARPLHSSFSGADISTVVGSPCDVSQLLSYEKRCMSGHEYLCKLPTSILEEA